MFGSTVLDVVIGLVFIYLLYSLLATLLQEIVATNINLRAKTLKKGIERMLDDDNIKHKESSSDDEKEDNEEIPNHKDEKNIEKLSKLFYKHPLIKYLGQNRFHSKPSYLTPQNFSKVLIDLLRGEDVQPGQNFNPLIQKALNDGKSRWGDETKICPQTLSYLKSLWADAHGDVEKFKSSLEQWFSDTMERASGWYKKKTQVILFFIGFFIAASFNVDTISIAKNLSTDKKARDQLVSMANAYVQNNKTSFADPKIDSSELKSNNQKLDSFLEVKKALDIDITKANTILGLGGWPPNKVTITKSTVTKNGSVNIVRTYTPPIDSMALSCTDKNTPSGEIDFSFQNKLGYLFRLMFYHFFGFLITALAISLGAPFWFDLLNKLMKLRSSVTNSSGDNKQGQQEVQVPIIKRVG